MNYWLSCKGESATGPYAETQLHGMWKVGSVTAADQVCPTDVPDAWMPLSVLIDEIDTAARRVAENEKSVAAQAAFSAAEFERRKKSGGIAIALSFFLPMGGQFYAGAYWQAALGLVVSLFGLWSGAWGLTGLIWLGSIGDAPGAVTRFNKKLEDELGIRSQHL